MRKEKTVAEFFAGIGLMRAGLEAEGWRVVYANDISPEKAEMYADMFPGAGAHFHIGDIHAIDANSVPRVTLATASFPCTDLSLAGGKAGLAGKHSSAFWGFVRLLREKAEGRPPLVLLENVTGLLTSNGGRDLAQVVTALNGLGYCADMFIVDAANFVPQSRKRLFIVGVQESLCSDAATQAAESDSRPAALVRFVVAHPELRWSFRALPPQPRRTLELVGVLDKLPDEHPDWWSEGRVAQLLKQMSGAHRAEAERMAAGAAWSYGLVSMRTRRGFVMAEMRTDGLVGCLVASSGSGSRQVLFCAGAGRYRARHLSTAESARLMGFDGSPLAPRSRTRAMFGLGDAVCVPVVSWIARHYLNPLLEKTTPSTMECGVELRDLFMR